MESDSDSTSSNPNETETSILSAEIKEIRNKIMSVKKSVTKGDKKQKKAVQEELERLEALLTSKQEELQRLKSSGASVLCENKMEISGNNNNGASKAKLKKERRREEKAAEWEANRQAALAEIASKPNYALEESKSFNLQLSQSGFRILEISADGHCLFSAIGCQLEDQKDHWQLRSIAANHLRHHREDFEHFIDYEAVNIVESESSSLDDKYEEYCKKIESTGMWGGQIEIEALSQALNISITVIQAQGPELKFNDSKSGSNKQEIYLSYHRFAFSLGEHYNALLRDE